MRQGPFGRVAFRVPAAMCVAAGMAIGATDAEACFCPPMCAPKKDSIVFEATVIAIGPSTTAPGRDVVTLRDVQPITGPPPRALLVDESTCAYPFKVGGRYRIEGEPAGAARTGQRAFALTGAVSASQCGATRAIWGWSLGAATVAALSWMSGSDCLAR